ncbi:MAG TPA: biotin--[acetyl-CoA-carboxylase] ligase [Candidatus Kapabacteria bacterium]|nr:biotin--[acetyl-CoA-carboxylase] ligase [Candidatus Kapabacteria bacterium]
MDIRAINTLLTTRRIGKPVEWQPSLDSTNIVARARAQNGAPEGLVIGADVQTAGRGRFNRSWESSAGDNLLFSVLLRPPFPIRQYALLNFLASLSVAEAIEQYPSLHATLHWPNDVYINSKKVCGILSETGVESASIIIGIGLNVNQNEFSPELAHASSLARECGHSLDRGRLLHILLKMLDENYDAVISNGFAGIMEKWRMRCDMIGRQLSVQSGDAVIEGEAVSVADNGALCIRQNTGETVSVYAGEATLHGQQLFSEIRA